MNSNQKSAATKKRKIISIIITVAIAIFVIYMLSTGGFSTNSPTQNTNDDLSSSQTIKPTQQAAQTEQPAQTSAPTSSPDSQIDLSNFDGPYDVAYVLDGDTIIADIDGDHIKIRLIGINSPESVHYDERENTPEGDLASDFAKSLMENNQVWLEYDIEQFDQYGRTLAYVYTAEHGMINDYILLSGYAEVVFYPPNDKYLDRFENSEREAMNSGAGLWGQ
jgi:endonuclease YncB( thermonuclease family)